jgi:hypothetical protein
MLGVIANKPTKKSDNPIKSQPVDFNQTLNLLGRAVLKTDLKCLSSDRDKNIKPNTCAQILTNIIY